MGGVLYKNAVVRKRDGRPNKTKKVTSTLVNGRLKLSPFSVYYIVIKSYISYPLLRGMSGSQSSDRWLNL